MNMHADEYAEIKTRDAGDWEHARGSLQLWRVRAEICT